VRIASCVACIALAAATARADDAGRARELYEDGLDKYDAGNYVEAIRAWQASYVMSPSPILLFNIGQAYRLSGDCAHAMELYDRYQQAQPKPDNRAELDDAIAQCKPKQQPPPPPAQRGDHRVLGAAVAGSGMVALGIALYCAIDTRNITHVLQTTTTWGPQQDGLQSRGHFENALGWTTAVVGVAAIATGAVLYARSRHERTYVLAPTRGGATVAFVARF
jgi:hypothetical protein